MPIPESRTKGDGHAQDQKPKATNEDVAFKLDGKGRNADEIARVCSIQVPGERSVSINQVNQNLAPLLGLVD
ncbi:hypothetical protein HZ326_26350 [Fusarium oxysporum f. sp. albedinis]|nr:hypothetical protein HZ326_26350 [Fusarium oxysporum f. sp. albedinis]